MVPRRIAQWGRRVFPRGLWEGPESRRWVALTIDDGPHPELTPRLLAALRRAQAPATFFVIGAEARRHSDLVHRMWDAGHEVGNHTWSHRPMLVGRGTEVTTEIGRTEELLARRCPGSLRVFRPPFGVLGPGTEATLARYGLQPVYWSVVPADWNPLPPGTVERRVLRAVHPGAVIVLHGGEPRHAGTAAAVEGIAAGLRERGYEIVPLSRMLAAAGYSVGVR